MKCIYIFANTRAFAFVCIWPTHYIFRWDMEYFCCLRVWLMFRLSGCDIVWDACYTGPCCNESQVCHYNDVTMKWRLKSPAFRLFAQRFVKAQIKENIKTPCRWPLWGDFPHNGPVTRKMFPFDDEIMTRCYLTLFAAANLALAGSPLTIALGENLPSRY